MIVHPLTHDIVGREDINAINGAVMNIIKTKKGERLFNPQFGSTIYNSLFEPMSIATRVAIEVQIENALQTQEPRITLRNVTVKADPDRNGYDVFIVYNPVNESQLVELDFFLERLR